MSGGWIQACCEEDTLARLVKVAGKSTNKTSRNQVESADGVMSHKAVFPYGRPCKLIGELDHRHSENPKNVLKS